MVKNITEIVKESYSASARGGFSSDNPDVRRVAEAFGYSEEELRSIPAESNLALSCGNPTATANLQAGETVVDLGSGGGLDVFLAASKVGPTGRAIGVDMTPEMIALARRNAASGNGGKGYANVEFHLGAIDALPLPDACADVVISNCVINLAPDKNKVFAEMFRVLKPGGRVAVSDIALKATLPAEIEGDVTAYAGCIAGAITLDAFRSGLSAAGFSGITLVDSQADLNVYATVDGQSACCSPPPAPAHPADARSLSILPAKSGGCTPAGSAHSALSEFIRARDLNDYLASVKVFALKPS